MNMALIGGVYLIFIQKNVIFPFDSFGILSLKNIPITDDSETINEVRETEQVLFNFWHISKC